MKHLLLVPIRLYWLFVPEHRRPLCLFKESCSVHVSRIAQTQGFLEGLKALRSRYHTCRPGYRVYSSEKGFQLELRNGYIVDEAEISERLMPPHSYYFQDKCP